MLIAIIEATSGWNRKWAPFSQRQLARASGLDRMNSNKGVRVLVEAGVVAQRIQGNASSFSLLGLGPEEGWSHRATSVAQCIQKWSRRATKGGRAMLPEERRNTAPSGRSTRSKDSTKESTKDNKLRGASRRSHSPEQIADVNWAVEEWKRAHELEPKWSKSSYVALYQTRRRLAGEFRTTWEKYLRDKADWLRDHSPEMFSKYANKWRVVGEDAASGYRRPSDKTGQVYPIDQEG